MAFDIYTGLALLIGGSAVVGGVIGMYYANKKIGASIAIVGSVFLVAGIIMAMGLISLSAPPATTVAGDPAFDVVVTIPAASTWESYKDTTNTFTMAMAFNSTSDAFTGNTQYFSATFNVTGADIATASADQIVQGQIGNVGIVVKDGEEDEKIITHDSANVLSAIWTKTTGATAKVNTMLLVEAGESAQITLNVTLNALAVANMDKNDMATFSFSIAGEVFDVNCIYITETA